MRGPNENEGGTASSRLLITARFANRVWDSQKFGRMRAELYDNGWARKREEEGKKEGRETCVPQRLHRCGVNYFSSGWDPVFAFYSSFLPLLSFRGSV